MGDRLWTGKPPWHRTSHPGQLSLSHPSMGWHSEYPVKKWGTLHDTLARICGLAVSAGAWLRAN